ncbi:hypothetical protein [Pelagibacterium halotolerans]|nr:hypothetical protein [Pelagibacterium halotolerans]QJR17585.1 hypothetical protein HKM20_03510 [Pelagibacterium halotolerans]SEA84855.1 hypothetical protein SAMN05428936_109106 [Pelagibacterium halotolerans]
MRLSAMQYIKRWFLTRFWGSYTHPDGTIELDIDYRAGIDPTVDDEETQDRKFDRWNRAQALRELKWQWFTIGAFVGGAVVWWWMS